MRGSCGFRRLHPRGSRRSPRSGERGRGTGPAWTVESSVIGQPLGHCRQQVVSSRIARPRRSVDDDVFDAIRVQVKPVDDGSQTGPIQILDVRCMLGDLGKARPIVVGLDGLDEKSAASSRHDPTEHRDSRIHLTRFDAGDRRSAAAHTVCQSALGQTTLGPHPCDELTGPAHAWEHICGHPARLAAWAGGCSVLGSCPHKFDVCKVLSRQVP